MKLIKDKIRIKEIEDIAEKNYMGLVKGVVDVNKEIMVIDANLHADEEEYLLEHGSLQEDLWGINIYPKESDENLIEFDSMINVRPMQNNYSRGIDDEKLRKRIINIVKKLLIK